MNKTFFVVLSLVLGLLAQIFLNHYISLAGATPQAILLCVVAIGFVMGPILGQTMGFFWGLAMDAMGIRLFGMNACLLALAGYISGKLRRRVASERLAGQMVSALTVTIFFQFGVWLLSRLLEERHVPFFDMGFLLRLLFNLLIVSPVFLAVDRWITLWRLDREHV